MVPVILSGGSGTRLWPLSRQLYPKQLLPLTGNVSMLQQTISRLDGLNLQSPIVLCNEENRFLVAEQLRELDIIDSDIILEPIGRNTAPAIAIAAFHALKNTSDAMLLVLPADHVIENIEAFHAAISNAELFAYQDKLVTFGIIPDKAETGYGYIMPGSKIDKKGYLVDTFIEKPDLQTAEYYLSSGNYLWNSGMFMFKASCYLDQLKQYQPEVYASCELAVNNIDECFDYFRLDKKIFSSCPSVSIDYAVMENTDAAVVIPLDIGWSDVGSWSALWEINNKDSESNVLIGDVVLHDVSNSYIHTTSRLVSAIGVDNIVIIETSDAVLVSSKNRVQDVKVIVEKLNTVDRQETIVHREASRPWGNYYCIGSGDNFQIKRIVVKSGSTLSLQMHYRRAEHWIVVKGVARVTKGDDVFTLSENESTFIPLGVKHRLENPGIIPLEIIEIQSGSYLGEDDIVRFDDTYERE